MPFYFIIWDDVNERHVAEHGVTPEEFEEVVMDPDSVEESRSSGRTIAFGQTSTGKRLACVMKYSMTPRSIRRRRSSWMLETEHCVMPKKPLVRIRRPLTADERRRVQETYLSAEAEKDAIIARGRKIMRQRDAARTALRETFRLLKSERQAQGITLRELEGRTGIGRGALSRLENDPDPNPTVHTLQRYAAALGKQIVVQLASPDET